MEKPTMTEPKRVGRPPEPVPQDVADAIVEWLYAGKSLLSFCEQDGMPTCQTIYRWCDKDEAFALEFARARRSGAATRFDRAGKIVAAATPETVQVAKLQAEHEYKAAACFCPALFGSKVQMGGDGGAPIKVETSSGPAVPETASLLAGIAKLGELAAEHFGRGDDETG